MKAPGTDESAVDTDPNNLTPPITLYASYLQPLLPKRPAGLLSIPDLRRESLLASSLTNIELSTCTLAWCRVLSYSEE